MSIVFMRQYLPHVVVMSVVQEAGVWFSASALAWINNADCCCTVFLFSSLCELVLLGQLVTSHVVIMLSFSMWAFQCQYVSCVGH